MYISVCATSFPGPPCVWVRRGEGGPGKGCSNRSADWFRAIEHSLFVKSVVIGQSRKTREIIFKMAEHESANTPKKVYISSEFVSGCRLCGNTKDRLINVFHKPAEKKNLAGKVSDILGVSITYNDEMSKLICRGCERKVMNFWEFKDRVQVFQSRIESSMSVKRCNNAKDEANNKRMTTDCTRRSLFLEESEETIGKLPDELLTSDATNLNALPEMEYTTTAKVSHVNVYGVHMQYFPLH